MSRKECETIEESLSYRRALQVKEVFIRSGGVFDLNGTYAYPICPRCDIPFENDYQKFCSYCGQKLKWTYYSKAKPRYARSQIQEENT